VTRFETPSRHKHKRCGQAGGQIRQLMTDEQIIELADNLDSGLRCFVHRQEKKIVTMPDIDEHEDSFKDWNKVFNEVNDSEKYFEIKKMDTNESFRLMTNFIETVGDSRQKNRFEEALSKPRPFRNFKFEVDQSGPFRQQWFDFKRRQMIEWVKGQVIVNNL
jgi:membrane-associated HD superfamily phosphohydrolase